MVDTLNKNAKFRFKAKGASMWPWIKNGDVLTISPLPFKGPRLGDVVPYAISKSMMVVHRIVGKQHGKYLICADNATDYDGLFSEDAFYGRVSKIERNNRDIRFGLGPERVLIAWMTRWRVRLRNANCRGIKTDG